MHRWVSLASSPVTSGQDNVRVKYCGNNGLKLSETILCNTAWGKNHSALYDWYEDTNNGLKMF